MRLLLDSSGAELVVALADERGVVIERRHPTGSILSRDIGTAVGEVLGELAMSDLVGVVVGSGPGTFIGSRVAISYGNGLAAAGKIQLAGVNSLAAVAAVHGGGRCAVLRDAGRNEVYWLGPAGDSDCRLVAYENLVVELASSSITTVVLEEPGECREQQSQRHKEILAIASRAGAQVTRCPGVPTEGLRRLASSAEPVAYVEPVYLRGYL